VILNAAGGDAIQGRLPISSLFNLGGPFSLPGYAVDELSGETFAVARAMYRYKLSDSSETLFGVPLYAGVTLVAGNTWPRHGDFKIDDLRYAANVFLAADTIVGPVFVTLGAADRGRTAFYVFVGKPF
jgi:NTE family protein